LFFFSDMSDDVQAPHRPVRKLCSCNAVLCSPEESATAPDTELFGVLLLNSPANTEADFAEYVRLYHLYRGGGIGGDNAAAQQTPAPKDKKGEATSPYFVCADGAYAALKRYCAARYAAENGAAAARARDAALNNTDDNDDGAEGESTADALDGSAVMAMQLCDVLIGDMDSLSSAQLRRVVAVAGAAEDVRASSPTTTQASPAAAAAASSPAEEGEEESGFPRYHKTVAAIPVSLLEVIRQRRAEAVRRRSNSHAAGAAPHRDTPVVLPITCQLSTDFHKGVALLERLRRLEKGNTENLTEDEQAAFYLAHQEPYETAELVAACDAQLTRACEEAERQAGDDNDEATRCRRLIMEVSPSTSATVRTQVLPNVAVLGALGGRIDHEVGAMVCVLRFARIFHLIVVNAYNVLFACWPDGVTQLLMPPSWKQQTNLSKDPAVKLTEPVKVEPYMCGIVPFGVLREMETTGCLWNVVKGRRGCYDGFTQTNAYRFTFDGLVSVCNIVSSRLVTTDVRPTTCDTSNPAWDAEAPSVNPPTLFMLGRPKSTRPKAPA
jgi:thiamine pyrophosphokinase